MDSDLLTLSLGAVQYGQILLEGVAVQMESAMQMLAAIFQLLAFVACFYVMGAVSCRLKGSSEDVATRWIWIHRSMLFCSVMIMWCFIDGDLSLLASFTLSAIAIAVAVYMHSTRRAWVNGPPPIARRKRELDETLYA